MSLASVIAGFRKRIQSLERGVGRLERRLGTELPPEWEAAKLAVNPLNLGYTPIVPLVFGTNTCVRMKFIDGRLQADPDGGSYGFSNFDGGSPRFEPFPGAKGWGIPYTPGGVPSFLVLHHQGMGLPVRLTGCAGLSPVWSGYSWQYWWSFKWQREDAGAGWDPPLRWDSPGCSAAILLNSGGLSRDVYHSLLTERDWPEGTWLHAVLQYTAGWGFFFNSLVSPTFGTVCASGQIPGFNWYPVMAEEEGA